MGAVRAAIFRNTITHNGRQVVLPKVVLEVRYKDKAGQWQGTSSLSLNDLPKAILALQKAFEHLTAQNEPGEGEEPEVITFSLPSHTTCPGASPWCLEHCYAHRYERLRPACRRACQCNLMLAQQPDEFVRVLTGLLPRILPCMRIHVSGDFHSAQYCDGWRQICAGFPQTRF